MKFDRIRQVLHARPFQPFWIHLAQGGRVAVEREDFVALDPTGREMIVYLKNGSHQILDVKLVTGLETKARNGVDPKKRR